MVLVAGRANKHFLAALEHGVRIGEHWLAINAVTCGALPPIEVLSRIHPKPRQIWSRLLG